MKVREEKLSVDLLRKVCEQLVKDMGGQVQFGKATSHYSVFYKDRDSIKTVQGPGNCKDVHYKLITDTFFHCSTMEDQDYLVTKQANSTQMGSYF